MRTNLWQRVFGGRNVVRNVRKNGSRKSRRTDGRILQVEALEDRQLLAVAGGFSVTTPIVIATQRMPVAEIHGGDYVPVARFAMSAPRLTGGNVYRLGDLDVIPAMGSQTLKDAVIGLELWGDFDRRPGFETCLDKKLPGDDLVTFEKLRRTIYVGASWAPKFEIRAQMVDTFDPALGDQFGVEVADATFTTLRGQPVPDSYERYTGSPVLHDLVMPEQADLSLALAGPREVTRGEDATYTVIVRNDGPSAAKDVNVVVPVPTGMPFDAAHSSAGWSQDSGLLRQVLALQPGMGCTFTVSFDTNDAEKAETVSASVYSPVTDPNPANNGAQVVTEVTAAPELYVTELVGPATDTAVSGQKNLVGARFSVFAQGGDELVTSVTVSPAKGYPDIATNCALWVDTDGKDGVDTILQKAVHSSLYQFTFDNLSGGGYVVPNGKEVQFEMHFDVISGHSVSNEKLQFTLSTVEAEVLNTGASVGTVNIVHTAQTLWSFEDQGTLWVTKDPTPVREQQLLAGGLSDTVLRLNFHAEDEPGDVTEIQISVVAGQAQSVDRLELYKDNATSYFAIATTANAGTETTPPGYVTFVAHMQAQQLVVPEGGDQKVLAKLRLRDDRSGAISGESIQLFVSANNVINNSTGEGAVHARGAYSSNNLAGNDEDDVKDGEVIIGTQGLGPNVQIVGANHTVVCAKPVSFISANPDAPGSAMTAGIEECAVQLTAAANINSKNGLNKVVNNKLKFVFDTANAEYGSRFELLNKVNPSVTVAATAILKMDGTPWGSEPIQGQFQVVFDNLSAAAVDTVFDSGESDTLAVRYNRTNPQVSAVEASHERVFLSLARGDIGWYDRDNGSSMLLDWVDNPDSRVLIGDYAG